MELQSLTKLDIQTFDPVTPVVKITVGIDNAGIKCGEIIRKVCKDLGIKEENENFFTLCEGKEQPTRRYKPQDVVPVHSINLSFQKWCFELKKEKEVIHRDQQATVHIFFEAQYNVSNGKVSPSSEEAQKLEDCGDPDFPADGQYLNLCQKLPGYNSILVKTCVVGQDVSMTGDVFAPASHVNVRVTQYGLIFSSDSCLKKYTWYNLLKWSLNKEEKTMEFVMDDEENAKTCLPFATPQAEYLHAAIVEMISLFQKLQKDWEVTFHTDMVQTFQDGTVEWTNGFFNPARASCIIDKL